MLFLKYYKYSLFFLFIFGVCPFVVDSSNKRVVFSRYTWMYSIFIYATISISSIGIFSVVFLENGIRENFSDIQNIVIFAEFASFIVVYVFTFASTIIQSTVHLVLINRLHELVSKLSLQSQCSCCNMKRLLLRIIWKNIFTVFAYISINTLGFFWFENRRNAYIIILFSVTGWIMMSGALAVLHVKDLCDIVLHLCAHTRLTYIVDAKTVVKDNSKFIFGLRMLMELNQLTDILSNCFGVHLLFGEVKDLFLTTTATFYLISSTFYVHTIRKFSLELLIFICIYIIPHMIKNGLLIRTLDRMGKQVCKCVIYIYFSS